MTVKLKAVPAVTVVGADTEKCVAAPGLTVIVFEVPVMLGVTVSVAVIVCGPAVLSTKLNCPTPLSRVLSPLALMNCGSVLVRWTVPL